ncbi:MAG: hypothetical protein KAS71_15925 [Bacteroidales bacterium]|nr:hypothetical protein [Bacteroidales bacterium]
MPVHRGISLFEGNGFCFQSHTRDYYGSYKHHFHKFPGEQGNTVLRGEEIVAFEEGTQCINCLIPTQYQKVLTFEMITAFGFQIPDLQNKN